MSFNVLNGSLALSDYFFFSSVLSVPSVAKGKPFETQNHIHQSEGLDWRIIYTPYQIKIINNHNHQRHLRSIIVALFNIVSDGTLITRIAYD